MGGRSKNSKNFLWGLNKGEIHFQQNVEYDWDFLLGWNEHRLKTYEFWNVICTVSVNLMDIMNADEPMLEPGIHGPESTGPGPSGPVRS